MGTPIKLFLLVIFLYKLTLCMHLILFLTLLNYITLEIEKKSEIG